jgi:hypothetical protein
MISGYGSHVLGGFSVSVLVDSVAVRIRRESHCTTEEITQGAVKAAKKRALNNANVSSVGKL